MDDTCSPPSNPLKCLQVPHFPTFLDRHHSSTTLRFNLNRDLELDEDMEDQAMDNHSDNLLINACDRAIMGEENAMASELDKEPLFEKPLTPSDVGKLNRLVIPKQYAEKYFPLSGDSGDKGLLLSFEDESGKYWRFRYWC